MEKILNKILEELNHIKSEVSDIKSDLKSMNTRLDNLEEIQTEIQVDVKEINRKTSVIFDQTAHLTEFTTATTGTLGRIEEEMSVVEKVTAKNCFDITHLKSIK